MKFWGIVPKVAVLSAPYAAAAFYLNDRFNVTSIQLVKPGIFLMAIGVALWLFCYFQVSRAYAKGELLTTGCYSKVRHPIYSIWGFLILPGFSLVVGGFMLALPIVYWLSVLVFIGEEEQALEERFGDEWRRYAERTPRFIPRP
ncbi:methyltransferase family protein [Thermococcus gorgonarius]|uniref:Protein-S-isoprenylcysteine methyltransferase n=1 Tax=Thermococcus gorgonarius TaxID=71997 RepID=A0A2Z2M4Y8_THEGO|nr:isoprenylcysteine carboxylmethyltransferase family protein [Thermococcus gorgonarius]ASJ01150.1 protein-S-isoprenylcysteine methyltransferase [Thermococcus gorgonarius]